MDKNNCGKPQFGGAASDSSANRVKLTDVVWFQEGPGVRNYQHTSHGVKLLNVANLHEGKLDTSNTSRYISDEEAYGRYKHFLVDEGDLIVASSGIKVEYFDQKMGFADKTQLPLCMNTSTIRFKARSPHELDINYFMCYLKSDDFKHQLERQITGSAQLNFGPSHLKRMSMPLPPLAHQLEVAERIAYIDKQIDDARTVLSGLDNLVKSRFNEMFEGVAAERQSLPSIVWFQEGPGVRNHQYASHGVKLLNVANLRDGKLDTSNTDRYISETEAFGRYRHFIVDAGDLIIASSGIKVEYFEQKMGFANKDQLPLCMNTSTIRFKPIDPSVIDMQYFMYYLKSDDFKRQLERNITGSAQLNFGPPHLKRMTIPVPSIMVQKQFSQFVRQVDKLRFDVQQQIDKLELFKNSLMQEYFG